jgi:hypothetical protein
MMSKVESLFFISLSFVLFKDWTFFGLGDSATGLFCCGRLWYWTFLLWEILLLDFFAVGDSDAGLSS